MKTIPTKASVAAFIRAVPDEARRKDCRALISMMREATGARPKLWGSSIVGFGSYHYRYATGREGDWFLTGFSPRKQDLTIYITPGFLNYRELLKRLGRHSTGRSCLYIKRLADLDLAGLEQLIRRSVQDIRAMSKASGQGRR